MDANNTKRKPKNDSKKPYVKVYIDDDLEYGKIYLSSLPLNTVYNFNKYIIKKEEKKVSNK